MTRALGLRLGIDVGGTNTDAVVVDAAGGLVASAKVPTTADVTGGIVTAMAVVLTRPGVEPGHITHAMLGTTHATNAILQRRDLQRVAVLRIGSPATHAVRPLYGWPADLRDAISVGEAIVPGGIEFDGREIVPFDAEAVARFLGSLSEAPDGVAIVSVFSPVSPRHEEAAAEVVARELGSSVAISLSHEVGSVGLLERENATVLNLALSRLAAAVAVALRDALTAHGLDAVTAFFAQNDGTLMALDQAIRLPVLTIGSGPANSLRGAAALSGLDTAIVVDVGGTTTDVGVLVGGFPRESATGVDIGGIRTNFRMPDIVSIAIGGGTEVVASGAAVHVGPASVGFRLTHEALVFGGPTPTLTDAAVAAGRLVLGDPVAAAPSVTLLAAALAIADERLADGVDRVKTARGNQPVIAVGGGAALVPDDLPGASSVLRPANAGVANAIGAAIAPVSGTVDRVETIGPGERPAIISRLGEEAEARAVAAGAAPGAVEVVEVEEIPLAYLTTPASRFRVKAAGPMA